MKKIFTLDKQLHFLGCFFIAASLFIAFSWVWLAAYAAILAGVIKECVDSGEKENRWSWGDIIADVGGVVAFIALVYLRQLL